jgi:hypothetical protein
MNSAPLQTNCFQCGIRFVYEPIVGPVVIHPKLCKRCYDPADDDPRKPRPGEVPMKEWYRLVAKRRNLTVKTVISYVYNPTVNSTRRIPYPSTRRVNARIVFVRI